MAVHPLPLDWDASAVRERRGWADRYTGAIVGILEGVLGCSVREASREEDCHQCIDFHAGERTVAARVRYPDKADRPGEFIVRWRETWWTSEWAKWNGGTIDLAFSGVALAGQVIGFSSWVILDVGVWRAEIPHDPPIMLNRPVAGGGGWWSPFNVDWFSPAMVLACSWE